ncbi:hypothetical protein ACU6U9_10640 [Pseudomonas sp. HK3]
MLLRSLFFLLVSAPVFSAGITIDVDLQMTIDAIKYIDPKEVESDTPVDEPIVDNKYAQLIINELCPEPVEDAVITSGGDANELSSFLSSAGFSLIVDKSNFEGSNIDSFVFHEDTTWTVYDDINRKLVRNWDEGCVHAPRKIDLDTNVQNIKYVYFYKELELADLETTSGDGGVINFGAEDNLDWMYTALEKGKLESVFRAGDGLYGKISGGTNTGIWQMKSPQSLKMTTSLTSEDSVIQTQTGLMAVSKGPNLNVKWLEKKTKNTYKFRASSVNNYHVYPFSKGTMLVADKLGDWKFEWVKYGEKEKIVIFPAETQTLSSCHAYNDLLFCLDRRDTGEVYIWRFSPPLFGLPRFILDSKIEAGLLTENMRVNDLLASKTHRMLFVKNGNEQDLISVSTSKAEIIVLPADQKFNRMTKIENAYISLDINQSEITISKIKAKDTSVALPFLDLSGRCVK